MTSRLAWRTVIITGLLAWAVGGYCFIRSDFAVIFPGPGTLLLLMLLSLLLLLPGLFVAFLWALPDLRSYTRGIRWRAAGRCGRCGHDLEGTGATSCNECGQSPVTRPLEIGRLACMCIAVWLVAGILGSFAGEAIAQLDERAFRQEIQADRLPGHVRDRWWPLMGELRWNDHQECFEARSPWS